MHPWARVGAAALTICVLFSAPSVDAVLRLYSIVALGVVLAGIAAAHARFVVVLTLPILLSLSVVWGWAAPHRVPLPDTSGPEYALYLWLRLVACGGVLQTVLLPLAQRPAALRGFLQSLGVGSTLGILIMASIALVPEVRRRLDLVVDARRAQGVALRGAGALREAPRLLMPVVSSLLESASRRAELWEHRGLLARAASPTDSSGSGVAASVGVLIASGIAAWVGQ